MWLRRSHSNRAPVTSDLNVIRIHCVNIPPSLSSVYLCVCVWCEIPVCMRSLREPVQCVEFPWRSIFILGEEKKSKRKQTDKIWNLVVSASANGIAFCFSISKRWRFGGDVLFWRAMWVEDGTNLLLTSNDLFCCAGWISHPILIHENLTLYFYWL